jgi:lipoprotein-anchoring transpeptidase ErfK/SrfK
VRRRAAVVAAGVAVALVAVLAGAGYGPAGRGEGGRAAGRSALPAPVGGSTRFHPDAPVRRPRGTSLVATARGTRVAVRRRTGGRRTRTIRARPRTPLTFLVARRRGAWLKAHLPTRPNLATGWIRRRAVTLATTPYAIEIHLRAHRLTLRRRGRRVLRATIAKGRAVSPTPTGRYYVTDLLRPPEPHGFYGPYALGLSAHSDVYTSFAGGDGQIGIHGTDRPSVLGGDVSHGCIRVRNSVVSRLAARVPLGTPVDIRVH